LRVDWSVSELSRADRRSSVLQYSNSDGSYYYFNSNGSTYHNDGSGGATYTGSDGNGWSTKK
jgi:hypothetical protein